MTVKRMDNVGIVVEDIDAAIEFFTEPGLELEGRARVEGDWADRVTGLRDMRVEIAMMRTPDGHNRLEMSRFLAPPVVADRRDGVVPGIWKNDDCGLSCHLPPRRRIDCGGPGGMGQPEWTRPARSPQTGAPDNDLQVDAPRAARAWSRT